MVFIKLTKSKQGAYHPVAITVSVFLRPICKVSLYPGSPLLPQPCWEGQDPGYCYYTYLEKEKKLNFKNKVTEIEGHSLVSKALATQALGPEFRSPAPT